MRTNTNRVVLPATVGADVSESFQVQLGRPVTVGLFGDGGLVAGEFGTVQVSANEDGAVDKWQDAYQDGNLIQLDSVNNVITIYGPGTFRVNKAVTTNPAEVYIEY